KRTGESETIEIVSFDRLGTEAYSDKIDGDDTNILRNGVIYAKHFIYNGTQTAVPIDTDGDGVNDFSLASETFYWKIGIIEDTEYALKYWVYLTGSMEGERDSGSYPTNESAVLWYTNYLGHACYKETFSPVLAWEASTISYEFYLVNADGQPVNSAGVVVPFEQRVLIGNRQTHTFLLNNTEHGNAMEIAASANIPEAYHLFNPEAVFTVVLNSGADPSTASIDDNVSPVTTYYYDNGVSWKGNGTIPSGTVVDYGNTHVAFAVLLDTTIVPDTVVIDYGLPVKIHTLMNDLALPTGTKINNIGTVFSGDTNTAYSSSQLGDAAKELTLAHGAASIVNGDTAAETYVKYTPADMQMSEEEVFYYEVFLRNEYYYARVTVIPAANIYYEDSFLEFIDGSGVDSGYEWKTAGEVYENVFQAEDRPGSFALAAYDANNVYGNDAAYDDSVATYSLGTAKYITVDAGCKVKPDDAVPRATFTFCGTGFDVISVTSAHTGALTVTVRNHETGAIANKQVINTFYGYSYGQLYLDPAVGATLRETNDRGEANIPLYYSPYTEEMYTPIGKNGEKLIRVNGRVFSTVNHSDGTEQYNYAYGWLPENTTDGVLYQIPVIKAEGLPYGVYDVTIQPRYAANFDETNTGSYDVYVDGIRIYNPAGTGDIVSAVVAEAYEKDNETNPIFASVRNTVIKDKEDFLRVTNGVGDQQVGGTIMVDGMFVTAGSATALADLQQSGPNNEMYLAQYQALAFRPAVISENEPTSFQLGMKVAITDSDPAIDKIVPSNASVRIIISDVKKQSIRQIVSMTVSGSAEQFYDLSPLLKWTKTEDETTYVADYDVVILNDSELVLSLTTFKTTFRTAEPQEVEPVLEPEIAVTSGRNTMRFASMSVRKVLTSADTSTLDIDWLTTDLTVGAEAVLSVTTSDEIVSVMIGGTEITEYTQNEDGTRTWKLAFTVTENGESCDIVLKDAFGRVSETFNEKLPMHEEPETTQTEETEPDPGREENDGGDSGKKSFFERFYGFIMRLLEFFKSILSFFSVRLG
ncbi:MAG: hypothetical protein IJL26_07505, partial [Clostridia bacterium]|nr:hypothetical protein [Clostridia bacterium]